MPVLSVGPLIPSSDPTGLATGHQGTGAGAAPAGEGWYFRQGTAAGSSKGVYVCKDCGKEYLHYSSVHKHRRFECGKEPQFQCCFCSHRTKLKSNLKKHLRNSHNWPPVQPPTAASLNSC